LKKNKKKNENIEPDPRKVDSTQELVRNSETRGDYIVRGKTTSFQNNEVNPLQRGGEKEG